MRVLILSGSALPIQCGISSYTDHLVRQLSRQGLEVRVVTHVEAQGSDTVHNVIRRWSLDCLSTLVAEVRDFAPDLLHFMYPSVKFSRSPFVNLLPLFLKLRFHALPLVITLHEYHDASRLGRLRALATAASSDLLVVSNEQDAAALRRFPWRRLATVPLGNHFPVQEHTAEAGRSMRQKYGLPSGALVGFAGFVDAGKGVERLVRATAMLHEPPALLFLSGFDADNPLHRDLRRLADERGVALFWPGYLEPEEVSLLIQECQVMVFPFLDAVSARRSTFIASLVHGRATIATGVDTGPFVDGTNCVLVADMTAERLAENIRRLLADEPLRRRLGSEARKLERQFDWDRNGETHNALYRELLSVARVRD